MKIAVLQGPDLNRLGRRNPAKYGRTTLAEITADLDGTAAELEGGPVHLQSNSEAALIDFVHDGQDDRSGIVINPAGLSAAGYPLLDAVRDTELPYAVCTSPSGTPSTPRSAPTSSPAFTSATAVIAVVAVLTMRETHRDPA